MLLAAASAAAAAIPVLAFVEAPQAAADRPQPPPTRVDREILCYTSAAPYRVDEAVCLKQLGDIASRQGDQLRLRLLNGKNRTLASAPKICARVAEGCILYQLAAFFPARQMILIHVQLYEGDFWLLINQQSGSQIRLIGPPHFSPSGSRLVSINWDESELTISGIDIWSLRTDPPTLEWRNRREAVEFERWLSDERLMAKMFYGGSQAELIRANGKWELLTPNRQTPLEH